MPIDQGAVLLLLKADGPHPPLGLAELRNIQQKVTEPLAGFVTHDRCIKVIAQQGGKRLTGAFRWRRNEKCALGPWRGWHQDLACYPQKR